MSEKWLKHQERGTPVGYRFMMWVAMRLGRRVARVMLYPICGYFVVCSKGASKFLNRYLERVHNRASSFGDRFRLYHCFASTLLDRVYFLTQQGPRFDIAINGVEPILHRVDSKVGCLLIGSHLGSFEVVRASTANYQGVDFKFVMHEDNAAMINSVVYQMAPSLSQSIINIGRPDSMLRVKECVDQGGVVGILGDRVITSEKTVTCQFLGKPAPFPIGPMLLASVLRVPVFLFFGLYRGGNRYEVHFELFAEQVKIEKPRKEREVQEWIQRYVDRLEHYCRLAPDNWFNFYDYWNEIH